MRKFALGVGFAFLFLAAQVHAQSLVGAWQGTAAKQQLVLVVSMARDGALSGEFHVLGSDAGGYAASTITVHGNDVSFALDNVFGIFSGTLSADRKSIAGTWKTGGPAEPLTLQLASGKDAWVIDPSPHKVRFVAIDKDTRLEVLDWGGSGPPLVFLAGLGNTAHVFDALATHFTATRHVYGITRPGFGASSTPAPTDENYDPDRLADNDLAVIDALKLDHPVIAGHSIAGSELSSIGTRHPEKIRGLIYLDAAFSYAYYDPKGDHSPSVVEADLRRKLRGLSLAMRTPSQAVALYQQILSGMEELKTDLQPIMAAAASRPDPEPTPLDRQDYIRGAIMANERKFAPVTVPTLAIAAVPHQCAPNCDSPDAKSEAISSAAQASAFEKATPSAHVVRLPYANHYIWRTNEADVLREMNVFLDGLKKPAKTAQ